MNDSKVKIIVDANGLLCPLPVLRLRKALNYCSEGDVVKLLASDPAASIDVPHYCIESGNIFMGDEVEKNFFDATLKDQEQITLTAYYVAKRSKDTKSV